MRILMTLVPACLLVAGCSSEQGKADEKSSDTVTTATAGSGNADRAPRPVGGRK